MWNYDYIIPSILILLVFLAFFFLRPRLDVSRSRLFVALLLVDLMTVISDYFSSLVDEAYDQHSVLMLYILNMLFFVFFIARGYCFYLFAENVSSSRRCVPKAVSWTALAIFVIAELTALSSPFTGAVFFIDSGGYHSGSLYHIINVEYLILILLSSGLTAYAARSLLRRERMPVVAVQIILLAGISARFMLPHFLIMDVFCLTAIIIYFLAFENPDMKQSGIGTSFNQAAFHTLMDEWQGTRQFRILGFAIHSYSVYRGIFGARRIDRCLHEISAYLSENFPGCSNFYLENGCFALAGPSSADTGRMRREIAERFTRPWDEDGDRRKLDISFVEYDSASIEAPADRIVTMLLIALESAGRTSGRGDNGETMTVEMFDDRLNAERDLEAAIDNNRVEVFIQPIVDSSSGCMVAGEALARIYDESGTVIPPSVFIPIAERNGRITQLGEQVFRGVCSFIMNNNMKALGLSWINVNMSPYQMLDEKIADQYADILKEYGLSAEQVHLEITEQAMIDYTLLKTQMSELQGRGFVFVLDDFGSGYSNMIRLRQYDFCNIKLDMEIVWDYCREASPILPSFVRALKDMGLTITAEGIEDAMMAEKMREIGCDYLQGFYYARPMPAAELLKWKH